ncbi:MAG: hypothetical protein EWV41_06740 [Microcystis wesenbergii Mw_MB_S_20031200_S109]|uniref:Uncharacterized protein n=1 Tax=Microcystis wesenbergii Mw_MB_S_20031200_S109D TaxID=2486241 RepID=A0A552M9Z2_9CHRO|nr:MAG: hypothetical protein EWV41_06740 [Microcystis wesenbergii Mw_MB_S_20031200_S109]TRV29288.1 MAG: hypothetical protein EWV88_01615 [Microcystis wesenbergii Mw_MB_S_20031200_S109D]
MGERGCNLAQISILDQDCSHFLKILNIQETYISKISQIETEFSNHAYNQYRILYVVLNSGP